MEKKKSKKNKCPFTHRKLAKHALGFDKRKKKKPKKPSTDVPSLSDLLPPPLLPEIIDLTGDDSNDDEDAVSYHQSENNDVLLPSNRQSPPLPPSPPQPLLYRQSPPQPSQFNLREYRKNFIKAAASATASNDFARQIRGLVKKSLKKRPKPKKKQQTQSSSSQPLLSAAAAAAAVPSRLSTQTELWTHPDNKKEVSTNTTKKTQGIKNTQLFKHVAIIGDGGCMYRAIHYHLVRFGIIVPEQTKWKDVKRQIFAHMKWRTDQDESLIESITLYDELNPSTIESKTSYKHFDGDIDGYINAMSKPISWGGVWELRMASSLYNVTIELYRHTLIGKETKPGTKRKTNVYEYVTRQIDTFNPEDVGFHGNAREAIAAATAAGRKTFRLEYTGAHYNCLLTDGEEYYQLD